MKLKKFCKVIFLIGVLAGVFLNVNMMFGSIIPEQGFLSLSTREPQDKTSDAFDGELRFGITKLNLYTGYYLFERENYHIGNQEIHTGYGYLIKPLQSDKFNIEYEGFYRERYDNATESLRIFMQNQYKKFSLSYGLSLMGEYYKDYQPAGYIGFDCSNLLLRADIDRYGRGFYTFAFKNIIPFSKTLNLNTNFEVKGSDGDWFWWFKTTFKYDNVD